MDQTQEPKTFDWRWVLFVVLALLFGLKLSRTLPEFWWDRLPGPNADRYEDLIFITQGSEAVADGRPAIKEFYYPPACYWFGYVGLRDAHRPVLGTVLAFGFLLAVLWLAGRMKIGTAGLYLVLLCSPPISLAIWRGNLDLLIFILLAVAAFLVSGIHPVRRACGYALILYTSLLKIYPIVSSVAAIREKRNRALLVLAALAAPFALYAWLIRENLHTMSALAPRNPYLSFGSVLLLDRLSAKHPYNGAIALGICGVVLAGVGLAVRNRRTENRLSSPPTWHLDAFRIGAVLYVSCFALIQYNFIYRDALLFLTVPQWLSWREESGNSRKLATTALTLLVLAFWTPRYPWNWTQLDQVWDWALFALYGFALLETAKLASGWQDPQS